MNKRLFYTFLVMIFGLAVPVVVVAQILPPDGGEVIDTPIDGGLSILLAAGVGYGIKKVRDGRKERKGADVLSK